MQLITPAANLWTTTWKWLQSAEPDALQDQIEAYSIPLEASAMYEEELEKVDH